LTVLPQFQLDGVSPAVQNQIVELVKRGLAALGEFVHLQGAAPAPLLLPRTCLKVREWRRDGKVTSECIEVREQHVTHSPSRIWPCGSCGLTFVLRALQAAPASGSKCLSATHNASLFASLSICQRPGSCRTEAGGTPVLADLVLYVTSASGGVAACGAAAASSRAGGASAQLAAAGGACETDPKSGRPVAGVRGTSLL
jgi:ribosomal protein L37AE/L43A